MRLKFLLAFLLAFAGLAQAKDNTIYVSKSRATVCAPGFCAPVLVGMALKAGHYPVLHAHVVDPLYGGDVLAFDERADGVPLAIHRVWLGIPAQRRIERLQGPLAQRIGITGGCINVMPEIYQKLVDCCSKGTVIVTP